MADDCSISVVVFVFRLTGSMARRQCFPLIRCLVTGCASQPAQATPTDVTAPLTEQARAPTSQHKCQQATDFNTQVTNFPQVTNNGRQMPKGAHYTEEVQVSTYSEYV